MAEFRMPSLGSDMKEGTLLEWRVKPGDRIRHGDIIAVVDTDKAAIEIEVFEDGVVEALFAQPGQKIPVGTVMALIRQEGMLTPPAPAMLASVMPASAAEPLEPHPAGPPPGVAPGLEGIPGVEESALEPTVPALGPTRVKASPYARRLATEGGVDLGLLRGTGPGGTVRAADVERALSRPGVEPLMQAPSAPAEERPPAVPAEEAGRAPAMEEKPRVTDYPAAMRRAIAAAMARSNREIPHYYLQMRIDMSRTLRWLESENLKRSIRERVLPVVPLIKAVALALGEVPELNGYWIDDRHQPQETINVGFAISLRQGGLITPAILQADLKSIDELMESLRDLITRTRAGRLRGSEMTDGTITVTSLGDLGVETVYGVIYPPQVALVGFGKIMDQPWVENGMLGVRPVLTATLAADHRATDGRRGAQFLDALNRYLQEPTKL
jgi:pyruvate dehydrogenase E2 component (dihydrolipoamide acetyltransferase)